MSRECIRCRGSGGAGGPHLEQVVPGQAAEVQQAARHALDRHRQALHPHQLVLVRLRTRGRGRGCGIRACAGQTPRGWVEAARTVLTSEMSAIGWSSGTCAHSSALTCTAREACGVSCLHSRSRHRERQAAPPRPGLAPPCESSPPPRAAPRPPGRGWRCEGRASDTRQGLGRRGAGRGLGRAGREARASVQHREHEVHRLAVARGLVHVLELQVLPRHAQATQGSARAIRGALSLGSEWGWAGQGAVCFARRGQSRTSGSRWKTKGPL